MKILSLLLSFGLIGATLTAGTSATRIECDPPAPLVFARGNTLWLLKPGASAPVQIQSDDWISPSSPAILDPAGEKILFSAHRRERYGAERGEINIDISNVFMWESGQEKSITGGNGISRAPDISPDQRDIVFVSDRQAKLRGLMPGTNSTEIYNLAQPWRIAKRLTSDGGFKYNPRWSPDGKTIAYLWLRSDNSAGIYMMRPNDLSAKPCLIAESGDYPTWRPDGKAIVYTNRGRLYETEIPEWGCPINRVREILPSSFRGFVSFPKWTDHGIIFQFADGAKQGIALLNPETRTTQILVSGNGEFGAADLAPKL